MRIIDIHTHGIGGYDTKGAASEDILAIAEIHGSCGVDAIIPTIYSASIEQMRMDIAAVKKAMEIQSTKKKGSGFRIHDSKLINSNRTEKKNIEPSTTSHEDRHGTLNVEQLISGNIQATILGAHLEGPFLNPVRAGALDKDSFLSPDISRWKKLIEGFEDIIKIVTVAPELDGATKLIRSITGTGIIVSMGHSDATLSEAESGFNAGAKGITHIFNAMRGIHHREPGIAGFGLINPHVNIEIIADPFHLHLKTIEFIFTIKNPDKIIIVSDSIRATRAGIGMQDLHDSAGRLPGGSMTVNESAVYLTGLGFQKDVIEQCISHNPYEYLLHVMT
jgi:N-acetylglucosamine-6-phosphate deacetylase